MVIVASVDLAVVRQHERATKANATLGSYRMDIPCPVHQFSILRTTLDSLDWNRLFLIGEFAKWTSGNTGRVIDIDWQLLEDMTKDRIDSFGSPSPASGYLSIDLRRSPELALVIVSTNAATGPLIIIDGNHRAISQFRRYGQVPDVPAFVCVHKNISQWSFVPHQAR